MPDKHNNTIELVQTALPFLYEVKLYLAFKSRYIGTLDIRDDGTYTTERKLHHLLRIKQALGINKELLTSLDICFKWIIIHYEGKKLITTREYFLAKGEAIQFSSQGFEPQIFLPISEFGVDRLEKLQERRNIQLDLFWEAI